jgi:hypothetical protein
MVKQRDWKVKMVKLSLCLTKLHCEDVWGGGCMDSGFLDLIISWISQFQASATLPSERELLVPIG